MQRARWLTVLRAAAFLAMILLLLALPSSEGLVVGHQTTPGTVAASPLSQIGWLILAVPLIAHGLAHLSGLVAPFTRRDIGFAERPWVFAHGVTPHSTLGRAFGLLWLAASLALLGAGVGLLFAQAWWAVLALAAAVLSLGVILIWWNAVPPGAKVGAAFDLVILLAALQSAQTILVGQGA